MRLPLRVIVRATVYIRDMSDQGISRRYLSERDRSAGKAKAKPPQPRQRFAVSKAVLDGNAPLHRVSKKNRALCGAELPKDISIVFDRIESVPRCEICGDRYSNQVLSKIRNARGKAQTQQSLKGQGAKKGRKLRDRQKAEAAKRGMKSWRPELYPGETADRNTVSRAPVPRPIGAPSLGKRR